jgi:predicted transcriptional regulator
MKTVSIRLKKEQDEELERLARQNSTDKSTIARTAIMEGLKTLHKKTALEKVRTKEWTIWKAASYCNLSYRQFLTFLREYNVPFPLSKADLELELNENRGK